MRKIGRREIDETAGQPFAGSRHRESALPLAVGDYLHSETDLFRVEQLEAERVLLEDCRSGSLLDVPLSKLLDLKRVRAS